MDSKELMKKASSLAKINANHFSCNHSIAEAKSEKLELFDDLAALCEQQEKDVARYQYLRSRDLDEITKGGIFAGITPENVVVNGEDLDIAIDKALSQQEQTP